MESIPQTRQLLSIVSRLRKQCPWDKKQTHRTLLPYLLEEAYETLEAIQKKDPQALREELGDLLLQIVLHAEIASESGSFDFEDVARCIGEKMVRRHPHVFGDERAKKGKRHSRQWTELKQKESPRRSLFAGTPKSMPSLQLCQRYGEIAASVGFDWEDEKGVLQKLEEEVSELKEEMRSKSKSRKRIAEELGDVAFTLANLARHLKLNAEVAARESAVKFSGRFDQMQASVNGSFAQLTADEWEKLWTQAKKAKKKR